MVERDACWHTIGPRETCTRLNSDFERGLDVDDASQRFEEVGPNELPRPVKDPEWKKLLSQLKDPLVGLLLVAAVVATVVNLSDQTSGGSLLQQMGDTIAIMIIVVLNAVLGYLQERRAERALDALSKMTSPTATVIREGRTEEIDASFLVPGDLVTLDTGDRAPADIRLIVGTNLAVDEAAMTGESVPVEKDPETIIEDVTPVSDRTNMVFMGCNVVRGHGRGMVAETGPRTHLGRIGQLIGEAENRKTPLEERLAKFGKGILWVTLAISALVFVAGLWGGSGELSTLFLVAVSLAVAVIPEGLPAISTITLALGMQRMARQGALVRRLPAVETLGCATVICSDKTGTLTCNEMTVREVRLPTGEVYEVEGEGYEPKGRFFQDGLVVEPQQESLLADVLRCGSVCTSSKLLSEEDRWRIIGDPTEGALLTAAAKGGLIDLLGHEDSDQRISEIPFAAERRMMSVVVAEDDGERVLYIKGSPDTLLPRCTTVMGPNGPEPLDEPRRKQLTVDLEDMARRAFRVLGMARRTLAPDESELAPPEEELTWLGMAGMNDPPRPEVKPAIAECRKAQVRVVMVTGDHALTAEAISRELGMWDEGDTVLTGAEIKEMNAEALAEQVKRVRVFARVTAEQKMDIVRAFQKKGEVVAVTGDGVNDAPALKRADVGVAMGRGGTDVAREASDMVLADDNFATIVSAVREGRAIFRNIQKFIFFLCSSNAGLCVAVFAASLLSWPAALTPLMILWINLVTNGLPALALGIDPPEPGQMEEGPRSSTEGLLGGKLLAGTVAVGLIMGVCSLALFHYYREIATPSGLGLLAGQLAAFMVLGISPLFHAFNCRSFRSSVLSVGLLGNRVLLLAVAISGLVQLSTVLVPPLRPVFRTTAEIGVSGWVLIVMMACVPLPAVEIFKFLARRTRRFVAQT